MQDEGLVSVEIELSLNEYFTLNELARKEGILLDEFIQNILKKHIEDAE